VHSNPLANELKKASTEDNFVSLLNAVHRKLGNTLSSEKQAWRTDFKTSGTFITLTYKTKFAEGEGAEQFVFRTQDNSAVLVG
jgi:hypothetical protein